MVNGGVLGSWISRIPDVQASLGLTEGQLGRALLGLSVGTIVSLPLAGGAVTRWGAPRITTAGLLLACVTLPLSAAAAGVPTLFGALVLLGAGLGAMDVAMNAQGVALERSYRRSIMVTFHGAWSVGGLVAAALGSAAIALSVPTGAHLTGAAMLLIAAGLVAWRESAQIGAADADAPARVVAWPRAGLWALGLIAFSSAVTEGAVADWSGVFLRNEAGAADAVAAWGFVGFSLAMAILRFLGDALASRFGPRRVVTWGGLVGGGGMLLAVVAATPAWSVAGFALVGAGVAAVVPLSFSAAGRVADIPESEAVAAVATIGYTGFLAGPPLIGLLADITGLGVALALVAGLAASLALSGRFLPRGP